MLAILGAASDDYAVCAAAIRQEHRHLPEFLYRCGRKCFIERMLASGHIFLTTHLADRYEQQVQGNLRDELAAL